MSLSLHGSQQPCLDYSKRWEDIGIQKFFHFLHQWVCNSSLSWKALWKLNGKKIRLHTFRSWKLWPNSTKDKQWDMNDAYFWWQDWHTTVSTALFKQSYKYPLDIRVLLWNLKSSLLHIISKIPHLGFPTYPKWKRWGEEKKKKNQPFGNFLCPNAVPASNTPI